ncbi:MAG TPA: hypothetical protein VF591_12940 [Pyrinomonadaceae bacterium]
MAKRDMKKALGASLRAEEDAVKSRFERAESVLTKRQPASKPEGRENGAAKADKVIRDSFTMPASDYESITRIKQRAMKAGIGTNKSEILRAGLAALSAMTDKEFLKLFQGLPKVKPGRPAGKLTGG